MSEWEIETMCGEKKRVDFINLIKSSEMARVNQVKVQKKRSGDRFKNFKRYYSLYNIIHNKKKYPTKLRQIAIKLMEKKHLRGLNEAVEAALDSSLVLPASDVKQLKRARNHLRALKSMKKSPPDQRRHILQAEQKGGFLSILLPIIAAIAGEGIKAAIDAKKRKKKH